MAVNLHRLFAACGVALLVLSSAAHAQFPEPPLDPGTRTMRAMIELNVPVEVAWNAFTTEAGMTAWTAPKATLDLSIGGLFRTSYDPAADLDGPNAIHQRVLAYEPLRMLSLRTVKAPAEFPHAHAITHTWGVTWFESLGPNRTRMTFTSMGWQDGPKWDAGWAFFEAGNAMLFDRMRAVLESDRATSLNTPPAPLRSMVHEVIVPAAPAEVWRMCATTEGVKRWMAPNARVDLRVGGKVQTNYDANAELDGPGTITHHILTFEPERLLAFRFDAPDTAPPAAQRGEECWWMIELDPVNDGAATRVRCTMHGFGEGPVWDETYRFFDAGNKWTIDQLAAQFDDMAAEAHGDDNSIDHPVLRELHRLVGGEWIHESTMPDGSSLLVRNVITPGPDGHTLISRGWLGDETGLFEHGATQVWIEPGTNEVRFQSIDEQGGISRGAITLNDAGTLIWDWNQHARDGSVTSFDVRMRFTGEHTYEMSIKQPNQSSERNVLPPASFTRVVKAPAKFMKIRPAPQQEAHAAADDAAQQDDEPAPPPGRDRIFRVDPVSLIDDGRELPGDADITAKFHKFTYRFANEANRQMFIANPERYEIQLGGACGRMGALSGEGRTDLFAVHDERLYIFASESCRNTFLKSADGLLYEPDPPLEASIESAARGRELLQRAVTAHGGALAWHGVRALRRVERETVTQADQDWLHVETITIRLPDDYRVQSEWNDLQWARVFTAHDAWFERERRTEIEPMHLQQRIEFEDAFHRELAVLLRASLFADVRFASEGEMMIDLGPDGPVTLDLARMQINGATTTLGVDRDRGLVRLLEYRGRGPSLAYGTVRRVLYDFRTVGDVMLPFGEVRYFNGELVSDWSDRRPAIEVNPVINPEEFRRPLGRANDVR